MVQTERRRYRRILLVTKVTYLLADSSRYYYSRDLSLGGIFLETRSPFPAGTMLDLDFELPGGEKRVRVTGRVVRVVKPDPARTGPVPGMGISFVRVSPEAKAGLEAFIAGR